MNKVFSVFSSKPLQIAIVVGGLILFIYFKGKADAKDKELFENPLPNSGDGIPITGRDENGKPISWDPTPLAHELENVLSGVMTWAYEKERTFQKLTVLTNDQLTALYNTFNKLFYDKSGETMTDWIANEFNVATTSVRKDIVTRLRNLNLR
jgi:hypothetical protein